MSIVKKNLFLPSDDLPVGYTRNGNFFNVSTTTVIGIPTPTTSANSDTTNFFPFYCSTDGVYYVSYNISSITVTGSIQEGIFKYDPSMVLGDTIINQSYASPSTGERQIQCNLQRGFYYLSLRSASGTTISVSAYSTVSTTNQYEIDFGFYINQFLPNGLSLPNTGIIRGLRIYDNSTNPALLNTYNGTISDFDQYRVANKYLFHDATGLAIVKICLSRIA